MGDMMSEKNNRKTIFKIIAAIILLFSAWWLTYGGGKMLRYQFLEEYFDIAPPGSDGTHFRIMTDEQQVAVAKKTLTPGEYEIWKKNFDLKYKSDEWIRQHAEEVKKIKSDVLEWERRNKEKWLEENKRKAKDNVDN